MELQIIGQDRAVEIHCPEFVFLPSDPWGVAFRQGLATLDFNGTRVLDAGCGSGISSLQVLLQSQPQALYLNDASERVIAVARQNVSRFNGHVSIGFLPGDIVDVLANWSADPLDCVIGCVPQVPARGDDLTLSDVLAHEYDDVRHPEFREWGLGLIHNLKVAAKKALAPHGKLVLVHSGRVPASVRRQLDEAVGFRETRVVHQSMVKHHYGTPLSYLAGVREPVLFRDIIGTEPIAPEEAEALRQRYIRGYIGHEEFTVHHSVLVVESMPAE